VDALASNFAILLERLEWFLDFEPALWLLLFAILVIRPPAVREVRLMMRAGHTIRYRHLLNLTRFRTELVKRQFPRRERSST
jgi:hypothetical protein